jgi:hypothetical protein
MMHLITPDDKPETPSKLKEFSWLMFVLIVILVPFMIFKHHIGIYYNIVYIVNFFLGFFWSKYLYPLFIKHYFWLLIAITALVCGWSLWEIVFGFYKSIQ